LLGFCVFGFVCGLLLLFFVGFFLLCVCGGWGVCLAVVWVFFFFWVWFCGVWVVGCCFFFVFCCCCSLLFFDNMTRLISTSEPLTPSTLTCSFLFLLYLDSPLAQPSGPSLSQNPSFNFAHFLFFLLHQPLNILPAFRFSSLLPRSVLLLSFSSSHHFQPFSLLLKR